MNKYEIVSLIPARGGSERVPRKNIRMIAGKPMLAWTIEASLKSKYVNRTFVSTEDAEIKKVALEYGAEVVDRPLKYASDVRAEFNGVVAHFRECMEELEYYPNYLVFLHATAPLRTAQHIDEAMELLLNNNYDLLEAVTPFQHDLKTAVKYLNEKQRTEYIMDFNRQSNKGRGIPSKTYISNGSLYIGNYVSFNYYATCYNSALAYIMKWEESIDVDLPIDFKIAEFLLKERIKNEKKEGG